MSRKSSFAVVPVENVPRADRGPCRPTVLVVDDESVIADTLKEILARHGYATMSAYDGQEALEIALLTPPELLITDVSLPGMSGIELAITIRRIFPDCKVLLFSGHAATTGLLATAQRSGHTFKLLTKPVHPRELLANVSECLTPRSAVAQ